MTGFYLFLTLLFPFCALIGATYKKAYTSVEDWDNTLYDWKIDVTTSPGEVKLLKTDLIADEMGITTGNMEEIISGQTWIKKEFLLDDVACDQAVLLIHWNEFSSKELADENVFLSVDVNNNPIKLSVDVDRMLTGGWIRCDVPVEYLKTGKNTVILKNETDFNFVISLEASRIPNRSAKSIDGGITWDYTHLGRGNFIDGEYLIRLRLARYPLRAEIKSDFIELASLITADLIKPQIILNKINISLEKEIPPGSNLFLQIRGGTTPAYHPDSWTAWQQPSQLTTAIIAGWQFFQWRVELQTEKHNVTPVLKSVDISVDLNIINEPDKELRLELDNNQKILRGYYQYGYQDAGEYRLERLKARYRLAEVVGGCSTEFQQYRTLAFWVKGIWRDGWGKHGNDLHTPWDALISLELTPQYKASGICAIYANTFIQTALAVGLQARGVILDHHFVSEVWSNEFGKWITFDVGNSSNALMAAFYESEEKPINILETHILLNKGQSEKIWIVPVGIHDKMNATKAPENDFFGPLEAKARFGIPLRNNYLTSWLPGELEHGFIQYHYDGYLWWKDTPIPKYEEYTYHSSHVRDFYWTLNQAQIFLTASKQKNELTVLLDSETPNFAKFQVRIDEKEWQDSPAKFLWILHQGINTIEAKPVNRFNKDGIISKVIIQNSR